jgi:hypothetical protein
MATQRGMNAAQAARAVGQQQAGQAQVAAGQSATLRAQEQQQAQAMLAQVLQAQRSGDIDAQARAAAAASQFLGQQRSGDVAAQQAATAAAQSLRQGDIAAQGQQAAMFQAAGQLEMEQKRQEAMQRIEQAKMDFEAGKITAEQRAAEENYWRNTLMNLGAAVVGGAAQMGAAYLTGGASAAAKAATKAKGGRIDGQPRVPGDHPANDTVPALLSPGEIVLPRTIAEAEDAPEKAAAFVRALQDLEAERPLSRRAAGRRIAELEAELAALRAMRANGGK